MPYRGKHTPDASPASGDRRRMPVALAVALSVGLGGVGGAHVLGPGEHDAGDSTRAISYGHSLDGAWPGLLTKSGPHRQMPPKRPAQALPRVMAVPAQRGSGAASEKVVAEAVAEAAAATASAPLVAVADSDPVRPAVEGAASHPAPRSAVRTAAHPKAVPASHGAPKPVVVPANRPQPAPAKPQPAKPHAPKVAPTKAKAPKVKAPKVKAPKVKAKAGGPQSRPSQAKLPLTHPATATTHGKAQGTAHKVTEPKKPTKAKKHSSAPTRGHRPAR